MLPELGVKPSHSRSRSFNNGPRSAADLSGVTGPGTHQEQDAQGEWQRGPDFHLESGFQVGWAEHTRTHVHGPSYFNHLCEQRPGNRRVRTLVTQAKAGKAEFR